MERLHQVIWNILVTNDLDNKVIDFIDPWGKTLAYTSWEIRDSYNRTIQATPGQSVFGRDTILKLVPVIEWQFITAGKHQKVDIDNVWENARRVTHDYAIDNIVYMLINGIYQKLGYKKQEPCSITEVFTNGTVRVQPGQVKKCINIRRLTPHFVEKAYYCS